MENSNTLNKVIEKVNLEEKKEIINNIKEDKNKDNSYINKTNQSPNNKLLVFSKKIKKTRRISKASIFEIEKLKKCNSKSVLQKILSNFPEKWKLIIKFYMTDCFVHDLYTRRLENKMYLLSKRELLYRLIDKPELLAMDCHFDNNLLKNFCTGIANFVTKHRNKISKILKIDI